MLLSLYDLVRVKIDEFFFVLIENGVIKFINLLWVSIYCYS